MSLLDDILEKTKNAVDVVGERAEFFYDISKLKIKLSDLKGKLRKKFENLGRDFYFAKVNNNLDSLDFESQITEIRKLEKEIENLEQKTSKLKNKKICKNCGHNNENSAEFCSTCGKELIFKKKVPNSNDESFVDIEKNDIDSSTEE
ncbi:MAG: zinc ribbon domain-containing protein [Candidatus Paraimprobicoccus trichonymphae]|uniref:Zinc ribbon domain-containing protein n=1 Tax=Candidatus Paraimprobicoccus trichonymphae TaxID=3033793 RepID=A0AA48HWS8_9FIRM|nr:MAG: zinc ribbon domain-containing protein [Candidatus Paraimprobicoccus trichonymphae]